MREDLLLAQLRTTLHSDVAEFQVSAEGAAARRAVRRLREVAEHSPGFLALLVEPWLNNADADVADTMLHCARVHLYARVLDDALDENLPHDRQHLLRAQPLLWRATYALGCRYPDLLEASFALMTDTVCAVSLDDRDPSPIHWGAKNHHLLLAPLLLSGSDAVYQAVRPGLSNMIAVSQALDEVGQGAIYKSELASAMLVCLPDWLNVDSLHTLQRHGWHAAAQRLLRDGRLLLQKLEQQVTI